jgi:hypothetical protein
VAAVQAIEVDEAADAAAVIRLASTAPLLESVIAGVVAEAFDGSRHSYRVRPGSWTRSGI